MKKMEKIEKIEKSFKDNFGDAITIIYRPSINRNIYVNIQSGTNDVELDIPTAKALRNALQEVIYEAVGDDVSDNLIIVPNSLYMKMKKDEAVGDDVSDNLIIVPNSLYMKMKKDNSNLKGKILRRDLEIEELEEELEDAEAQVKSLKKDNEELRSKMEEVWKLTAYINGCYK